MLTLITTQMLVQCELLLRDFTCLKIWKEFKPGYVLKSWQSSFFCSIGEQPEGKHSLSRLTEQLAFFSPKFCQQTYEYLHMNIEAFVSSQLSEWFLQLWRSQQWRVVSRQANLLNWESPLISPVLFLSKTAKVYMPWPITISRLAILLFHTYSI